MDSMQRPPNVIFIPTAPPREHDRDSPVIPELSDVPATSWSERIAQRIGRSELQTLFRERSAVTAQLHEIPQRMQKVTNQARLVLELIDDFCAGTYRKVSWMSIAVAATCLVYAVSPADVVPDALPVLGTLDDMIVLTLGMRFLEKDLRSYSRFKGYSEAEYFSRATS